MARMLCSKPCWAKAVSLSKVIDLRSAGFMRAKIASMTEMVSAAVFPASRAARVTRDLRSWRTSTGRVRLQMMRSPSQWPAQIRLPLLEPALRSVVVETASDDERTAVSFAYQIEHHQRTRVGLDPLL